MEDNNLFSVCLITKKGDKILAVSRKDNHNDFGLPGGKVDPGETPEEAIRREVKEETGLDIINLKFLFTRNCIDKDSEKPCGLYSGDVVGQINHNEPHVVKWVDPVVVTQGSFKDFNINTFKTLNINY